MWRVPEQGGSVFVRAWVGNTPYIPPEEEGATKRGAPFLVPSRIQAEQTECEMRGVFYTICVKLILYVIFQLT